MKKKLVVNEMYSPNKKQNSAYGSSDAFAGRYMYRSKIKNSLFIVVPFFLFLLPFVASASDFGGLRDSLIVTVFVLLFGMPVGITILKKLNNKGAVELSEKGKEQVSVNPVAVVFLFIFLLFVGLSISS